MHIRLLALAVALLAADAGQAADILAYRVTLQPDFARHAVSGITRITAEASRDNPRISLPLHDLQVTDIELDGAPLPVRIADGQLNATLPPGHHELSIAYHGTPREGLNFGAGYVNSSWQGCDWMLCDEDPGKKAPLTIELLLPPGYVSIASGVPGGEQQLTPDLVRHTWREERPYSSYLYGFAAGKFHHAEETAGKVALHYYGVADDEVALRRKFAPSAGMLAFLQEKAGVAMPHGAYRQLLIPGSEAQELSAFSVIGTDELAPMQADPQEDWAIVHEMAHQWWGNLLTCRTWSEFWLNEGITTFMVAAYKEHRWGHEAYAREMALQRKRYQAAIDAGYDKPLSYGGSYPSLKIRRAIQYAKGALFMDALRAELGDEVFWDGMRRYTRAHAGGSVVSRDLQMAMEQAAGGKLDRLFVKWVY
ncbi:MAG TPA: M1 family aminopeptidase [Burkholderiaceae bacterium]